MDWSYLIVWVAFLGALWWGNRWKHRAIRERVQHAECHRNFEKFVDSISEGQTPVEGGRVIWLNPEVANQNGDDS